MAKDDEKTTPEKRLRKLTANPAFVAAAERLSQRSPTKDDLAKAAESIFGSIRAAAATKATLPPMLENNGSGSTVDPYRTGAPGRRTASHLLLREAQERLAVGVPQTTLKDFAEAMSRWLERTHPNAPPTKPGTVENILRKLWQTNKKTQKKPTK